MKIIMHCAWLLLSLTSVAMAGEPVTAAKDQLALLKSTDPQLAANKKLVFDLFRIVFESARHDLADQYLAENYIQHNPAIPNGRAAVLESMAKIEKPKPIIDTIRRPLANIVAEGDLVVFTWVDERPIPGKPGEKYTTTWFDMFRVTNGKVTEHWDGAPYGGAAKKDQ